MHEIPENLPSQDTMACTTLYGYQLLSKVPLSLFKGRWTSYYCRENDSLPWYTWKTSSYSQKTDQEQLTHLRRVLTLLRNAGLMLKLKSTAFLPRQSTILATSYDLEGWKSQKKPLRQFTNSKTGQHKRKCDPYWGSATSFHGFCRACH